MSKHRYAKQKQTTRDREDNRKFMLALGIATVLLMLLMYFVFLR